MEERSIAVSSSEDKNVMNSDAAELPPLDQHESCHQSPPDSKYGDQEIQILAKTYEDTLRRRIAKKSALFILPDKLQAWHEDSKLTFVSLLRTKQQHSPSINDGDIRIQKLEETINGLFSKVLAENDSAKITVISQAHQGALTRFSTFLDAISSLGIYWTRAAFNSQVTPEKDNCFFKFREKLKNAPTSIVEAHIPSLEKDLMSVEEVVWSKFDDQRRNAELCMDKIITASLALYKDKMDTYSNGEAVPPVKLKNVHDKYAEVAVKHFQDQVTAAFTDEAFVNEFRIKFGAVLDATFTDYEKQNEAKLQIYISQMEIEIHVATEVLKSEIDSLLVGNYTEGQLREIYYDIHGSCAQVLDEVDCPDMSIVRKYKQDLKLRLSGVLQEAIEAMNKSVQANRMAGENILLSAKDEITTELNKLVRHNAFVDPLILNEEAVHIYTRLMEIVKANLQHAKVNNCEDILTRLQQFASDEVQRIKLLNLERKKKSEQVMEELGNFRKCYEEAMDSCLTSVESNEELATKHEALRCQYLLQFRHTLAQIDASVVENYAHRLQTELEVRYKSLLKNWEDRREVKKSLKKLAEDLEAELRPTILENPFLLDSEIDSSTNERMRKFNKEGLEIISSTFLSGTELFEEAAQNLRDLQAKCKAVLKLVAEEARKEQDSETEKVIQDCVQALLDAFNTRKIQPRSLEAAELLFVGFHKEIDSQFQKHWNLPHNQKEAEARARIVEKVEAEYEKTRLKIKKEIDDYERACKTALEETVEVIGRPFKTEIRSIHRGKFYPGSAISKSIDSTRTQAHEIFKRKLSSLNIPHSKGLELSLNRKFNEEREAVMHKNARNEKIAFENLSTFVRDQYSLDANQINNSMDLDRVSRNVKAQAEKFLQLAAAFDLQKCPDLLVKVHGVCAEVLQETIEPLGTGFMRTIEAALVVAEKAYRDSMDDGIASNSAMHPNNLSNLHNRSQLLALRHVESQYFVPEDGKASIEAHLRIVYEGYQDRNNLRCADETNLTVGIDLGTTTTCVAIYRFGEARVMRDPGGRNLTASYLYIADDGTPVVGNEAKDQAGVHKPEDTVYDAKRLIGRPFLDSHIQNDMKTWPFKVVSGEEGESRIIIRGKRYRPEEISAQILRRMKEIAETDLGEVITQTVITVPASFNDRQRDATRQAAQIAGLEVIQVINEPTSAAMAYASNWKSVRKTVLVFDFGGGTLDVTILSSGEDENPKATSEAGAGVSKSEISRALNVFRRSVPSGQSDERLQARLRVVTTVGDIHLGGEDFDKRLVEFCAQKFEETHDGIKLLEPEPGKPNSILDVNKRFCRLKNECEKAKCQLACANSSIVSLGDIYGDKNLLVEVTRSEFEEMNEDLFQRAIEVVRRALKDAKLRKENIDEVLMVGGSSRIPRMKALLEQFFGVPIVNLNQRIDIQEAVARGAAIQACILTGGSAARLLPIVRDVQPFSLGVETIDDVMSVIIPRNTTIPATASEEYVTTKDNQKLVAVRIYSGERMVASENLLIGEFNLEGIPPGRRGDQKVDVTMEVDRSGILNVTAVCVSTGGTKNLVIQNNRGRLSDDTIVELRNRLKIV